MISDTQTTFTTEEVLENPHLLQSGLIGIDSSASAFHEKQLFLWQPNSLDILLKKGSGKEGWNYNWSVFKDVFSSPSLSRYIFTFAPEAYMLQWADELAQEETKKRAVEEPAPEPEQCGTCRFWKHVECVSTPDDGVCRFSPPRIFEMSATYFPEVGKDEWCGKYERAASPNK